MADPARHHSCNSNSSSSNPNTRNSLRDNSSNQCSLSRLGLRHSLPVLLVNLHLLVMRSSNLRPPVSPRDNSSSPSSLGTPDSLSNPNRRVSSLNIPDSLLKTRLKLRPRRLCHRSRNSTSPKRRASLTGPRPRARSRTPSKIPALQAHLLKSRQRPAPESRVSACRSLLPRTRPSSSSYSSLQSPIAKQWMATKRGTS